MENYETLNETKSIATIKNQLLSKISDTDVDNNRLVIILPGIQGFIEPMQQIINSLKAEIWCTNYYESANDYTVSGIAKKLLPVGQIQLFETTLKPVIYF